jgi:hypothetical protein
MIELLDAGPLGLVTNPRMPPEGFYVTLLSQANSTPGRLSARCFRRKSMQQRLVVRLRVGMTAGKQEQFWPWNLMGSLGNSPNPEGMKGWEYQSQYRLNPSGPVRPSYPSEPPTRRHRMRLLWQRLRAFLGWKQDNSAREN